MDDLLRSGLVEQLANLAESSFRIIEIFSRYSITQLFDCGFELALCSAVASTAFLRLTKSLFGALDIRHSKLQRTLRFPKSKKLIQ